LGGLSTIPVQGDGIEAITALMSRPSRHGMRRADLSEVFVAICKATYLRADGDRGSITGAVGLIEYFFALCTG
jgi:hypothetical protein